MEDEEAVESVDIVDFLGEDDDDDLGNWIVWTKGGGTALRSSRMYLSAPCCGSAIVATTYSCSSSFTSLYQFSSFNVKVVNLSRYASEVLSSREV